MIAVIGATGNTGRAVVKELVALGEKPVAVVRDEKKSREVLGPDANVAVADLTDSAALEKALSGVSRVFVVTGHNPAMAEQQINVMKAAEKAGAEYLVRVSGGRAVVGPNSESVVGRGHHAIEEALKASRLRWVILRPGLFMQNTFPQAPLIKNEGKMVLAFPKDMPLAFIDVRDTGALAARVLRAPAPHAGKTYEFTGKLTSYGAFAEVFGKVLGKPVAYIETTPEQLGKTLTERGMPEWLVTHMVAIAKLAATGAFSTENTKPVLDIVGREPITIRRFVEDFRAVFA
jgi:uncharacterized protein YbjT (DUF2867 family)